MGACRSVRFGDGKLARGIGNVFTRAGSETSGLESLHDDAVYPEICEAGRFIASGLRAAGHSRATSRSGILADVARLLGCAIHDLDFLFADSVRAANDADPLSLDLLSLPEYGSALRRPDALLVAE